MKKIIFVAAMAAVLALTGCEKEGNELDVDISQLTGIWIRNNHYPEQVIGGSGISYTFSANGECKKRVFSIPDWTSVFEYTY